MRTYTYNPVEMVVGVLNGSRERGVESVGSEVAMRAKVGGGVRMYGRLDVAISILIDLWDYAEARRWYEAFAMLLGERWADESLGARRWVITSEEIEVWRAFERSKASLKIAVKTIERANRAVAQAVEALERAKRLADKALEMSSNDQVQAEGAVA